MGFRKSGSLPPCKKDNNYKLFFLTIEADPKAEGAIGKLTIARFIARLQHYDKCAVSKEVSETGYHHYHAVVRFTEPVKWLNWLKQIQVKMHYDKGRKKVGDRYKDNKISVRAFHARRGSGDDDYDKLHDYIKTKRFKDSSPDPDGPLEAPVRMCMFCKAPAAECVMVKRPNPVPVWDKEKGQFVDKYYPWDYKMMCRKNLTFML